MLGFNRWHLFKSLAAILCIAGIVSLAAAYFIPAPPTTVTIATAYKGSTFVFYGEKYREIFARAHVKLELRETNGAVDNLQGVFDIEGSIPPNDVTLLATTNRLLIRDDLHPEIVQLLLRTVSEVHGKQDIFQQAGEFPTPTDPEYPMAASAIDFYKNGPSFLQRHLPLWLSVHAQRAIAVLVAAIAIGIPLFNLAPKLYRWVLDGHMRRLYRRLRIIEEAAQTELTAPQVVPLQTELEDIDRAARVLPQRHSDLSFILEHHITLTRAQLASRLVEARTPAAKVA